MHIYLKRRRYPINLKIDSVETVKREFYGLIVNNFPMNFVGQ